MHIDPYILTFSAATVLATIWMGFWSARRSKTAGDFYVAGRSVSVGWNASAISGEYLSAASFMGVAGMVMSSGYDALWYPVCYACGYLFLLLFIAGPLRRFGAYTIPDFAEGRYDSPLFRKIAVVFVLFIGFFYTMPQMKGAGTTLAYIFPGLPYWAGVVLVGAVITLNVALGGMKGITLVQAFQYWAKMFAISVPIFVLMAVYGHYGAQLRENKAMSDEQRLLKTFKESLPIFKQVHTLTKDQYADAMSALWKGVATTPNVPNRLDWHGLASQGVSNATIQTPAALFLYSTASGSRMRWQTNLANLPQFQLSVPLGLTATGFATLIEKVLRTNKVTLVKLPRNTVLALRTDEAEWIYLISGVAIPNPEAKPTRLVPDSGGMASFLALRAGTATSSDALPTISESILAPEMTFDLPPGPRVSYSGMIMMPAVVQRQVGPVTFVAQNSTGGISGVAKIAGGSMSLPRQVAETMYRSELRKLGPSLDRAVGRARLPEKAPDDIVWINPFGPLTTKAAKTARPTISYSGQLQRKQTHVSKGGPSDPSDPPEMQMSLFLPRGEYDAMDLFEEYAGTVAGLGKRNFESWVNLNVFPGLESVRVNWIDEDIHSESDYSNHLLSALQTNGITVVRDGEKEFSAFPSKDVVITPIDPRPYSLLYTYSLIIALVCGTAGLPHILVRFYTNPDGVAAKRTTMWVMILIGVFYLFPPVFGVMGRNLLPELYSGVGAKGTDKVVLELPRILNEQVGKGEREKRGKGAEGREGEISSSPLPPFSSADTDTQKPSKQFPWGSILSGITCAGAFAAFMSTFSGLLVSMTGALAHDVYGRMLRPKSTPEQRLRAFKICAVIIGAVAILLGMQVEPLQINFMVGQAFAIAAASYFPLLFMSAWWRGMTMRGAAIGMLTGGLMALIGISLTSFSDLAVAGGQTAKLFAVFKPLNDFWATHPLWRILCEQPAIWTVPLAIFLMIVVSKWTRKEIPSDVRMKMLVLHAPEKLGLKQEYIQEHQHGH